MHEAQGETVKQGPSSRGEAWRGVPRPPAKLPRRGASPLAALARVRRVRRVPSSYRRLELSTRRGVIHARVSPRCPSERRWAAASGSSCNLPPSSPRTETVFFTLYFLSPYPLLLPPSLHNRCRPLGGIPGQLPSPPPRGGMATTAAQQPSQAAAHPQQQGG